MNAADQPSTPDRLGFSGSVARLFQANAITPLLALVALLLGLFAVMVTPREEEPQINVTMANVIIPFPGASSADVAQLVASPAEQVLSQIQGIEHTYSVARPGVAVLTVQFQVGVPRTEALVRLYDVLNANQDWLPQGLGVMPPIVKPKGIDDVPVLAATLWSADATSASELERVAHAVEGELKRVPGTREVQTIGGPGRAVHVWLEPAKLRERGVSVQALHGAIASANQGMPSGAVANPDAAAGEPGMLSVQTGEFLQNERDVGDIVVGVNQGRPVYLREVARVEAGALLPQNYVWFTPGAGEAEGNTAGAQAGQRYPAVTLTVTKKLGENAVDVARTARERLDNLRNTVIPDNVQVSITRDYGQTAEDKANKLIQKLVFATGSVIILVGLALGRREAVIVGAAVILTLTATLFASWAWGFTLNRVSLFALIFSIGILVDDAIVVVENIHRHTAMYVSAQAHIAAGDVKDASASGRSQNIPLAEIIPRAVDEVGGPTILATFTVIAALLPMAFVSGLMGPYMSPIPINASMGMAISLAIAFTVTPWLALKLMDKGPHAPPLRGSLPPEGAHSGLGAARRPESSDQHAHGPSKLNTALQRLFTRVLTPFLQSAKKRWLLLAGILVALMLSVGMTVVQWVVLKMLPSDNKSEYQVVLDMPAGTPLEDTAAALQDMSTWLATQPEVANVQGYAGTASPITFNGLVRQYYLRADAEGGDLQVNLIGAAERSEQSHPIAQRHRLELEKIAAAHGARIKVVEVPPGPPVLAPIVAEVYGPDEAGRAELARRVAKAFGDTPDIVGIDTTLKEDAPRAFLRVQRQRAESLGIPAQVIAQTVHAALSGADAAYLHDGQSRYAVPVRLQLPRDAQVGLDALLALPMKAANGAMVPLSELVRVERGITDQPRFTKNGLPVTYVVGDMAGELDSPLYGLAEIRSRLGEAALPGTGELGEYWIRQPTDPYRQYAIKWDGESQITYETFRDMGAAYGVGLILIYLLVVAQFAGSRRAAPSELPPSGGKPLGGLGGHNPYITPLVIMAPIPLTIIGVMPGHALLGAQFTATSMIGMIALAGIIVRNSILLVDFIELETARGLAFADAVVQSAAVRAQPIALTGLAAMMGAFFILDDPIFNGLAVSLIFGIAVSTLLTLVVIPVLYYAVYRRQHAGAEASAA